MSRFTGFSEKSSFQKKKKKGQSIGSDVVTLNFSKELDSTNCSIQVLERLDF